MSFTRFALAVLSISFVADPGFCQGWENLHVEANDYRRLRGINFLPTYSAMTHSIPEFTPGHSSQACEFPQNARFCCGDPTLPPYFGMTSSFTMWRYYFRYPQNTADIAQHLDDLKMAGINSVRVFLSFVLWEHYYLNPAENEIPGKNDFIRRFEHFIELCADRNIYVMPVLWDSVRGNPSYTDRLAQTYPYLNLMTWHASPGLGRLEQPFCGPEDPGCSPKSLLYPSGTATVIVEDFIKDCISAFHGRSAAFLMWDVWNEPRFTKLVQQVLVPIPETERLISETLRIIKQEAPASLSTTTVSMGARAFDCSPPPPAGCPPDVTIPSDPRVDVIALHPYGHTRLVLEAALWEATNLPGVPTPKPVICTEIGDPNHGVDYRDALDYAQNLPRPDLDPQLSELGIGFMPWVSSVARYDPWSEVPGVGRVFNAGGGLFYEDRTVREVDKVMAFVDAAVADGFDPVGLWSTSGPNALSQIVPCTWLMCGDTCKYVAQSPVPIDRDNFAYWSAILLMPSYESFTYQDFVQVSALFASITGTIQFWADFPTSNNPYNSLLAIDPEDRAKQSCYRSRVPPNSSCHFDYYGGIFGAGHGIPLEPCENPVQLAFLNQELEAWRNTIACYVLNQGGPYSAAQSPCAVGSPPYATQTTCDPNPTMCTYVVPACK